MDQLHRNRQMKHAFTARCLLSLVSLGTLAACTTQPENPAPTAAYLCEDNTRFIVRFEPDLAVVSIQNGPRYSLPQQRAASGMWYARAPYSLRGKGNDATWETPSGSTECTVV